MPKRMARVLSGMRRRRVWGKAVVLRHVPEAPVSIHESDEHRHVAVNRKSGLAGRAEFAGFFLNGLDLPRAVEEDA